MERLLEGSVAYAKISAAGRLSSVPMTIAGMVSGLGDEGCSGLQAAILVGIYAAGDGSSVGPMAFEVPVSSSTRVRCGVSAWNRTSTSLVMSGSVDAH